LIDITNNLQEKQEVIVVLHILVGLYTSLIIMTLTGHARQS